MAITPQWTSTVSVTFHCRIICFWKFDIKLFLRFKASTNLSLKWFVHLSLFILWFTVDSLYYAKVYRRITEYYDLSNKWQSYPSLDICLTSKVMSPLQLLVATDYTYILFVTRLYLNVVVCLFCCSADCLQKINVLVENVTKIYYCTGKL